MASLSNFFLQKGAELAAGFQLTKHTILNYDTLNYDDLLNYKYNAVCGCVFFFSFRQI